MKTENAKTISGANCPCDSTCPLGKALCVIGGKWKLCIICTLFVDGTQRYNGVFVSPYYMGARAPLIQDHYCNFNAAFEL